MAELEKEKEKEKKELEEEKKKPEGFNLRNVPTWMIVAGVVLVMLAFRSMMMEGEGRQQYLIVIIGVIIAFWLFSRREEVPRTLSPREARLLVEREIELNQRWLPLSNLGAYTVGPVVKSQKRDGAGIYYSVSVEYNDPFQKPEYYEATVPMKGPERGYVSIAESIGPVTGRERPAEKSIWKIGKKLREDPFFKDIITHR